MQNKISFVLGTWNNDRTVDDDIEEASLFMGPDIVPACDSVTLPGM
jgi:hypothetical protein